MISFFVFDIFKKKQVGYVSKDHICIAASCSQTNLVLSVG